MSKTKKITPNKVIAFCGAFNPPTVAHLHAAQIAMEAVEADKVIWVPSKSQYIADIQRKDRAFPDKMRVDMLQAMIAGEDCRNMEVLTTEIEARTQPKTYQTLGQIQELYPEATIFLLIGSDKLPELENGWTHIDEILEKYKVIVLGRFHDSTEQIIQESPFLLRHRNSFIVVSGGVKEQELSSTMVRGTIGDIRNKIAQLKTMVPDAVAKKLLEEMMFGE